MQFSPAEKVRIFAELASLPPGPVSSEDYQRLRDTLAYCDVPRDLATAVMEDKAFLTTFRQALDRAMRGYCHVLGVQAHAVPDLTLPAGYRVVIGSVATPTGPATPASTNVSAAWTATRNMFKTPPKFDASALSPLMLYDCNSST